MTKGTLVLRALAVILGALVLGLLSASPSSAHSRLVSTDPADGSVLSASPTSITFTFDEPLLDGMATISINDENGGLVTSAPVTPQGTSITLPVETPLADGTYQAAYRVVSADGHAVMGAISFTVAGVASGASTSAPAAPSATAPASTASAAAATPSPVPATPSSGGAVWVLWIGIAAVVVAIAAGVALVLRRGR